MNDAIPPQKFIVTNHIYVEHATYDEARAEANRLAAKHPGKPFYVRLSAAYHATLAQKEAAQ